LRTNSNRVPRFVSANLCPRGPKTKPQGEPIIMASLTDLVTKVSTYTSLGAEISSLLVAAGVETSKTDATIQSIAQFGPILQNAATNGVIPELVKLLSVLDPS
jgi:hypothetical protein